MPPRTPHRRRRRRRSRRPLLLLLVLPLALTGVALGAWQASAEENVTVLAVGPDAFAPAEASASAPRQAPRPSGPLLAARRPLARGIRIAAPAGILVDAGTGTVLWAKRPHLRRPIASTTKIMTAVLALERLDPKRVVTIDPAATRVAPFKEGLRAGERVEAWKLFYGLLLASGNDTALAVAIEAAGSRAAFLRLMNEKAASLGLRNTRFSTPSGLLDEGNFSTAWDLAALSRYAMWNPRFRAVVRTRARRVSWPAPTYAKLYVNHNKLLASYPGADGIKTGWTTAARHCLVASASRNGIRLIAVVLGSPDPYGDVRRLLDTGFASRG